VILLNTYIFFFQDFIRNECKVYDIISRPRLIARAFKTPANQLIIYLLNSYLSLVSKIRTLFPINRRGPIIPLLLLQCTRRPRKTSAPIYFIILLLLLFFFYNSLETTLVGSQLHGLENNVNRIVYIYIMYESEQ